MWDEEMADGVDVTSSYSNKDGRGINRTIKTNIGVVGDILDDKNWQDATVLGASLVEKVKDGQGGIRNRTKKAGAKPALSALNKLMGIVTKKKKPKPPVEDDTDTEGEDATATEPVDSAS